MYACCVHKLSDNLHLLFFFLMYPSIFSCLLLEAAGWSFEKATNPSQITVFLREMFLIITEERNKPEKHYINIYLLCNDKLELAPHNHFG